MSFQPLGNRVLVKRVEEATTTASGIYIPDNAKEKPSEAIVIAVSQKIEENISVDDKVMFGKFAGTEISIDGKEYLVLDIKDILGIMK
jgi:chaperonin GroES